MPKPGPAQVYRFYNVAGLMLYAGVTQDFAKRWQHHSRQQVWWPSVSRATVDFYASWTEATEVEDLTIAVDRPVYNIPKAPLSVMHIAELSRLLREGQVPTDNDAVHTMMWELAGQLAEYLGKPALLRKTSGAVRPTRRPTTGPESSILTDPAGRLT